MTNLLVVFAIIVAVFFGGYAAGHREATNAAKAAQLDQARQIAAQADKASVIYQTKREAARTVTQVITKEIERVIAQDPIYRADCFSDDGVRNLNAAIEGASPSRPASAVSGASAAE